MSSRLATAVNSALSHVGFRLVRAEPKLKPWDGAFLQWIAEAEKKGGDPNDVGDQDWDDDPLNQALEQHYYPHITPDSVVLELGPGTGRATRYLLPKCREMVLVDYSQIVCDWLERYLKSRGRFRVLKIDDPGLPGVRDNSIDVAIANGVFEHIDPDGMLRFLREFHRVLRPGGVAAFNFDNIMSEQGFHWFLETPTKDRCIFKLYHPETVAKMATGVGFEVLRLTTGETRFAFIEIRKPV
jgi:SAM-dependent methyltransferase